MFTRRQALKTAALAGMASLLPSFLSKQGVLAQSPSPGPTIQGAYTLPPLGFPTNALEPLIDARTMEIHHDKHHAAYVNKLNELLADAPVSLSRRSIEDLISKLDAVPEKIRQDVRNQAGGHANHSFFWKLIKPNGSKAPKGDLEKEIVSTFGSMDEFRKKFNAAALKVFGSGWAWLVRTPEGKLEIQTTINQDNPLMFGNQPLLGVDVWEHAYYLRYQNRRADYLTAFHDLINWDFVQEQFTK